MFFLDGLFSKIMEGILYKGVWLSFLLFVFLQKGKYSFEAEICCVFQADHDFNAFCTSLAELG